MDNPKTVVTMGTQETGRRQTKQKTQPRKLKNDELSFDCIMLINLHICVTVNVLNLQRSRS